MTPKITDKTLDTRFYYRTCSAPPYTIFWRMSVGVNTSRVIPLQTKIWKNLFFWESCMHQSSQTI